MNDTRRIETIVTDLVLTEPPAHVPPRPSNLSLVLLRAEAMPLHFYRYLYAEIGRDWVWTDRLSLDDGALAGAIHKPGVQISVLYGAGAPAGFYELDLSDPETSQLVYFGLMPEWIGRGIASWLLGSAIRDAVAGGAGRIAVNTCTLDHPRALALYQKLGFQPAGRRARTVELPAHVPLPSGLALSRD